MKTKYKKIKSLIINRDRWVRGGGTKPEFGTTELLNNKGRMCCLGFFCVATGVSSNALSGKESPCDLKTHIPMLTDPITLENTQFAIQAIEVNDAAIDEPEREREIVKLFKSHGVKLQFKD
jgi:hypothetical protein